jgi:hypothetical protein
MSYDPDNFISSARPQFFDIFSIENNRLVSAIATLGRSRVRLASKLKCSKLVQKA